MSEKRTLDRSEISSLKNRLEELPAERRVLVNELLVSHEILREAWWESQGHPVGRYQEKGSREDLTYVS
jgi:hypothetical protein